MPPKGDRIGGGGTRKTTWESNRMLSYCLVPPLDSTINSIIIIIKTAGHGRRSGRSRGTKREVTGPKRETAGDQTGDHGRSSGRSREIKREVTGGHGRSREIKREITGDQTGDHGRSNGRSREDKIAHHSGQTPFFHVFWVPRKV